MSHPLTPGLPVFSIEDVFLGFVEALNDCCFVVADRGKETVCVRPDGVFTITDTRVSLVCMARQVERYTCLLHLPCERPLLPTRAATAESAAP